MDEVFYILSLQNLHGVGTQYGRKMLNLAGSAHAAMELTAADLVDGLQMPRHLAQQIISGRETAFRCAETEMAELQKHSEIKALSITDERYPRRVAKQDHAPLCLFMAGDVDLNDTKIFSVIGTRKPSIEGREAIRILIKEFAEEHPNAIVVSGLAYGCDITAHREAMENGLRTVAVLPNGLGSVYPANHSADARRIVDSGGALLTSYYYNQLVMRNTFAERNKLIAMMSDCTILIQSDLKGGSLMTCSFALQFGKPLFAVPGGIREPMSAGPNALIKEQRARLITSAADVVKMLGWQPARRAGEGNKKETTQTDVVATLSMDCQKIYGLLLEGDQTSDDLSAMMGLSVNQVNVALFTLQMNGLIKNSSVNTYTLVRA